jgi:hydrogenase maturation protease
MNASSMIDCARKRILVAGIGNIFLGDDGFGVEVAQRLLKRAHPREVLVSDFGIRGVELAYALLDGYDTLILIDAMPRGGRPGALYLIEPELAASDPAQGAEAGRSALDAHSMDPVKVLAFARTLGASPRRTLLIGCEPAPFEECENYTEMRMGLSAPVQAAVDEAVKVVETLLAQLLNEQVTEKGETHV